MTSFLRLAHISDLHLGKPTYSLSQFLSKRWVGNFNYIFFRRFSYPTAPLNDLSGFFFKNRVEKVLLTGDLTTTAQDAEFELASSLITSFSLPTYVLPGNHDVYTLESAEKETFYSHFPFAKGMHGIFTAPLTKGWLWISIDCAVPTRPFRSYGIFTKEQEDALDVLLSSLPDTEKVILGCHFALFETGRPHHDLKRGKELQKLIKRHPKIKLFLHGHDHAYQLTDRRKEGFPIILNSGCSVMRKHHTLSLIDIGGHTLKIQKAVWEPQEKWLIDPVSTREYLLA